MAQESELRAFVRKKIALLDADTSWARGMRAKLRRGVGKAPGELPEVWEITLLDAPEDWNGGKDGKPSFAQHAIHAALTLYALHRQGKNGSVSRDGGDSIGAAAARLVKDDSTFEAVKRRFDVVATASEFLELVHHARSVVQLLKASDLSLDYPCFAEELYRYQFLGSAAGVRLRWGQDFYGTLYKNKDGEEEEIE